MATLLPGDTLKLDFGEVPAGGAVEFEDVARMTSAAGEAVAVTLALSGPVSGVVQRVGFSDGAGGIAEDGLSLAAGETARLAFGFDLGPDAPAGTVHGTLTVAAELAGVGTQRCEVPVAVTVVSGEEAPSAETAASPVSQAHPLAAPPADPRAEPGGRPLAAAAVPRDVGGLAAPSRRACSAALTVDAQAAGDGGVDDASAAGERPAPGVSAPVRPACSTPSPVGRPPGAAA